VTITHQLGKNIVCQINKREISEAITNPRDQFKFFDALSSRIDFFRNIIILFIFFSYCCRRFILIIECNEFEDLRVRSFVLAFLSSTFSAPFFKQLDELFDGLYASSIFLFVYVLRSYIHIKEFRSLPRIPALKYTVLLFHVTEVKKKTHEVNICSAQSRGSARMDHYLLTDSKSVGSSSFPKTQIEQR
jgi:hypothetical protein